MYVIADQPIEPLTEIGRRHIVAADGVYFEENSEVYHALYKGRGYKDLPFLETPQEFVTLKIPQIPADMAGSIVGFCDAVYQQYKAEAGLFLLWHPQHGYRLWCPPQQVSMASLRFAGAEDKLQAVMNELGAGWVHIGDVHSHPGFTVSPSGTDTHDEIDSCGLHGIVGSFDNPKWHWDFVIGGRRWKLNNNAILAGSNPNNRDFPPEWMDNVEEIKWHGNFYARSSSRYVTRGDLARVSYKLVQSLKSRSEFDADDNILAELESTLDEIRQDTTQYTPKSDRWWED